MIVVNGRQIPSVAGELNNQDCMNQLKDILTEYANAMSETVDGDAVALASLALADAATAETLTWTVDGTEGISMSVATTKTLGVGMSMSGAGTITTGILLDATTFVTPISITGAYTTGISLSGDGTTSISVTNGFSGTNMISLAGTGSNAAVLISGACGKGIEITGSCTTGIGILTGTYTTALSIAGTTTTGIGIAACTTGIAITGVTTTAISVTGSATDAFKVLTGTFTNGINLAGTLTTGVTIGTCTTGLTVTGATTTAISLASTSTDGIAISGACGDAIHISGTNTASALHISGDQVIGILYDVTAAATDALKVAVPTGVTLTAGVNIVCTSVGTVTDGLIMSGTGTYTRGILLSATAMTTPITISAGSITDAILISGTTPVDGIEISSACSANAINISGASVTGIAFPSTITTTGISFAGGGSYNPIHIGTKSNTADAGLILVGATDDTGGVMIFADDGGDTLGSVTSPIWTRYLITAAQGSGGPTATGMFAQLKTQGSITCTTGSYTALKAYNQAGTVTLVSGAEYGIINAGVTLEGNLVNTSGMFSGIDVNINTSAFTITDTASDTAGIHIRKTSASTYGWPVGLKINDAGAITGIAIGTCTTGISIVGATTAIDITSTAIGAAGRIAKFYGTCAAGNMTDGYGAVEIDLTLSGVVAGMVAASSTWVNVTGASVDAGSQIICVQNNGIYVTATGTPMASAIAIIGMRMQYVAAGGGNPGALYCFDTNISDNVITAIFRVNDKVDIGWTTGLKSGATMQGSVPLFKDKDGNTHYVNTYID